jgi:CheY-like chemotaxis protein
VLHGPRVAVVLVVNDDRDMLAMYEAILAEMGHRAIPRQDFEPAPETVIKLGVDGLVIDLQGQQDSEAGLRVIESLRSHPATTELPVVLCTGAALETDKLRKKLQELRVPVLVKPFPVETFKEVVSKVLPQA